jgi:hypothetical protein
MCWEVAVECEECHGSGICMFKPMSVWRYTLLIPIKAHAELNATSALAREFCHLEMFRERNSSTAKSLCYIEHRLKPVT